MQNDNLPTTATGTLSLMPETKAEVRTFAAKIADEVLAGYIDPLAFHVRLKALEMLLDEVMKDERVRLAVLNQADRYGAKSFDAFGAKIQVKEAGVKYDYSQCGSSEWQQRDQWVKDHTEARKNIETFLKALPDTGMADPETGEIVYPPARTSKTIVSVELK